MNSCSINAIEVIAKNKHKVAERCCLFTEVTPAPARAKCPVSMTISRKVQTRTVEHLLKADRLGTAQKVQYYYCPDPHCDVVYFSNENVPFYTLADVATKVFSKDNGDDVNVCYCFKWTRAGIKEELASTGKSTASLQIAKEVKAGNCACDIKNPKGECCLGDVNAYVKTLAPTSLA